MAFKLAELYTDVTMRTGNYYRNINSIRHTTELTQQSLETLGHTARNVFLGVAISAAAFVKVASDIEESESKFVAVFKNESKAAAEFAEILADDVNRSVFDLKAAMSQFQDTFVPLGFARDHARRLSQSLVQLGVDLSSFNNRAEPEVYAALQSALVGNHEAVRQFGIIITEATLKQELMRMGLGKNVKTASNLHKVMARLNIIMRSTSDAQGDAVRTAGSFENKMKAAYATVKDLALALGRSLIPLLKAALDVFQKIVPPIIEFIDNNKDIAATMFIVTASISGVLMVLAPLIVALGAFGVIVSNNVSAVQQMGDALSRMSTLTSSATKAFGFMASAATMALLGWELGKRIAELVEMEKIITNIGREFFNWQEVDEQLETNIKLQKQWANAVKQGTMNVDEYEKKVRLLNTALSEHAAKMKALGLEEIKQRNRKREIIRNRKEAIALAKQDLEIVRGRLTQEELIENRRQRIADEEFMNKSLSSQKYYSFIENSEAKIFDIKRNLLRRELELTDLIEDEIKRETERYKIQNKFIVLQINHKHRMLDLEKRINAELEKREEDATDVAERQRNREKLQAAKDQLDKVRQVVKAENERIAKIREQISAQRKLISETAGQFVGARQVARNIQLAVTANEEKKQLEVLKKQLTVAETTKDKLIDLRDKAQEIVDVVRESQTSIAGTS